MTLRAHDIVTARAARWVGIHRPTLYYRPVDPSARRPRADELLVRRRIRAIALRHGTYGIRRVTALVRHAGLHINRKRVRRILASEGLLRPAHLPRPRLPPTGRLTADQPNERWYTDLTYLDTTDRGPCPLISFLDGCTREVIAWRFLPSCGAAEASEVLDEAVLSRFPKTARATGLVLRSDGGSQFVAHRFREIARQLGIELEATRKRRPEDNGMIESYHGKLKADYFWIREPGTFLETRGWVDEAIRHWNEERPHSSLGYLTPVQYAKKVREVKA